MVGRWGELSESKGDQTRRMECWEEHRWYLGMERGEGGRRRGGKEKEERIFLHHFFQYVMWGVWGHPTVPIFCLNGRSFP